MNGAHYGPVATFTKMSEPSNVSIPGSPPFTHSPSVPVLVDQAVQWDRSVIRVWRDAYGQTQIEKIFPYNPFEMTPQY